jgi:hypothetical protein
MARWQLFLFCLYFEQKPRQLIGVVWRPLPVATAGEPIGEAPLVQDVLLAAMTTCHREEIMLNNFDQRLGASGLVNCRFNQALEMRQLTFDRRINPNGGTKYIGKGCLWVGNAEQPQSCYLLGRKILSCQFEKESFIRGRTTEHQVRSCCEPRWENRVEGDGQSHLLELGGGLDQVEGVRGLGWIAMALKVSQHMVEASFSDESVQGIGPRFENVDCAIQRKKQ